MDLTQAALERRSKELDAREAFIDEKAKALENAPVTLKVYDAQVAAKEAQLEMIRDDISTATEELQTLKLDTEDSRRKLARLEENHRSEIRQLVTKKEALVGDISKLEIGLASVNKEIQERKAYFEGQESLIAKGIEQGNEKLLDLKGEMVGLDAKIVELARRHTTLEAEVDDKKLDIQALQSEFNATISSLTAIKNRLEQQVETLQKEVSDAARELSNTRQETESKLRQLKEKEESIIAKRDDLVLERQQLNEDKRRWNSQKALYDI